MRYAYRNGVPPRAEAAPREKGTCPICGDPVISKCGTINVWHWAHRVADCDTWAEPDSAWHRQWQETVPASRREVRLGNHRADVITPHGTVVELQHSPISPAEIRCREAHYGPMIWVFDVREPYARDRLDLRPKVDHVTFRWKHARKSIAAATRPVLLDLGTPQMLALKRMHPEAPCGGWGTLTSRAGLEAWMNAA